MSFSNLAVGMFFFTTVTYSLYLSRCKLPVSYAVLEVVRIKVKEQIRKDHLVDSFVLLFLPLPLSCSKLCSSSFEILKGSKGKEQNRKSLPCR